MELIRISDSKLKIMLTEADMRRYALSSDHLSYENSETRRAVKEMLQEAHEETGFDAATDRLLIQVYPSREGGCELYITKIQAATEEEKKDEERKEEEKKKEPPPPPKEVRGRVVIYALPTLSALLAVCRQLAVTGYREYSAAYTAKGERCYLVLREPPPHVASYPLAAPLYHPAEEYGEKYGGTAKLAYIKEHASCIFDGDAVGRLAPLA